ncbi:Sec-independent protein translocase protein TatB [Sphingomonas faeni]|uniref:Sec-independent protein translocase protein TatB n=1 Tax=Sphingomonas faeni TaxID=185950 RepID=UPI0033517EA5
MFNIDASEFLLVAFVALIVIGPKDLPKAMRVVGYWVGKARGVARQFRSGFDSMVREAELEEMEKRWASENERIMREHPQTGTDATADTTQVVHSPETEEYRRDYRSVDHADDHTGEAVMVEKPVVAAAPSDAATPAAAGVPVDHDAKPVADRGPDLFDTPAATAAHPDDKTGKSDIASS